jgi:transposase-like protein
LRKTSFGKHGCPYCTSGNIGINENAMRDGLKYKCGDCNRIFKTPIKRATRARLMQ